MTKSIFISYNSNDYGMAKVIRNLFEENGYFAELVVFKQQDIPGLEQLLEQEIASRDELVVLVSEHSRKSDWVKLEHEFAVRTGKPLYCIDLDNCADNVASEEILKTCFTSAIRQIDERIEALRNIQGIIGLEPLARGALSRVLDRKGFYFMSYQRSDIDFVNAVRATLTTQGIDTRMDIEIITAAGNFEQQIQKVIHKSKGVIVIIGDRSPKDGGQYLLREIRMAQQNRKPIYPIYESTITLQGVWGSRCF